VENPFGLRYYTNMLDIKFIRENAAAVKDAAAKKNIDPAMIDELL
jgi:seryl-tRNA synthetase